MRTSFGAMRCDKAEKNDGGKMAKTIVNITGDYRLVAYDDRNWALEHYDEPRSSNPRLNEGGAKWRRTGNYFQRLGTALAYVFERKMREEGEPDEALADAMERAEAIRDELTGVCK